jgi:GC-rich sequence DNA-binding factor
MLWFESLLFYGCEEREQEKDDVDVALLPTIVEKVILPKLTGKSVFGIKHSDTLDFCF